MEICKFEKQIAKINVKADMKYMPPILQFVHSFSESEGLSSKKATLMEVAVEEACVNVIKHAYAPDEDGDFEVALLRRPNQIVISIEDHGIPVDMKELEKNENNSLGIMLMKSIADETIFQNLGERGKCIKIIKNISENFEALKELAAREPAAVEKAPENEPLEIRFMKPEEAAKLSRCIYHAYGYTYTTTFYYPEKIVEMINSGTLKSIVALDKSGEVVAHLGLKFPSPGAKIAESAQAAVNPKYRGRGLFEDMKKFAAEYARKTEMFGLYSESVTLHPYTQKGNIALGAKEVGLILAYIPETAFFKKIQDENQNTQRQAALLFYMKTFESPDREVYLPERHVEIIKKIYSHNELKRTFGRTAKYVPEKPTALDVDFSPYLNAAMIMINYIGSAFSFELILKNYRRELCEKNTACIYVFIPLSSPGAPSACEVAEKSGFSFAGIIPEYFSGDCIVYQFLNNVEVDSERICTASEFARELLKYIMNEYNNRKK